MSKITVTCHNCEEEATHFHLDARLYICNTCYSKIGGEAIKGSFDHKSSFIELRWLDKKQFLDALFKACLSHYNPDNVWWEKGEEMLEKAFKWRSNVSRVVGTSRQSPPD